MLEAHTTPLAILEKIANLIYTKSGIVFPPSHMKVLDQRVQSSFKKRFGTVEDFAHLLEVNETELTTFIGYVTTNHTLFFRSMEQFNGLGSTILPELIEKNVATKHIAIWSAACSSGEEPYSLVLYIMHYLATHHHSDWTFDIIATDIDETSLKAAQEGLYNYNSLKYIPKEYHAYITISEGEMSERGFLENDYIIMPDAVKKHITYGPHNLMDSPKIYNMDLILCRNVLIYFDIETQKKVVDNLTKALAPRRYFFVSPSETLSGISTSLHARMLPKCIFYTNDHH